MIGQVSNTPTVLPARSIPAIVDLNKLQQSNNKPTPTLAGNKDLLLDRFISRQNVIGKLPKTARLISADIKSWGQYEQEVLHDTHLHDVSQERMVWVVKVAYPDGISTRGGFFDNATQLAVVDAQTAQYITSMTTGDYRPETSPMYRLKIASPNENNSKW